MEKDGLEVPCGFNVIDDEAGIAIRAGPVGRPVLAADYDRLRVDHNPLIVHVALNAKMLDRVNPGVEQRVVRGDRNTTS